MKRTLIIIPAALLATTAWAEEVGGPRRGIGFHRHVSGDPDNGTDPMFAARDTADWLVLRMWIRLYSLITIAATVYGVTVAHVFNFVGEPWTNTPTLEAAVAEGSTMLRVGTALFGPRPPA